MRMSRHVGLPSAILLCGVFASACTSEVDGSAPPWSGSLAAGLERMESLVSEGAFDDALAVADRMQVPDVFARTRTWLERVTGGVSERAMRPIGRALDAFGFDALKDADRAEIEYARAIALLSSPGENKGDDAEGRVQRAIDSFGRARAAGGGARLDAVYDLGGLALAAAEAVRETIPEISGGPPPPPAAGSAMAADKDAEDPLDIARRGYLAAREHLIERLLLGTDADTRANAELVTRRLRELDEIERQREEQQQDPDQQDPKEGDDESDPESGDKEGDPEDQESDEKPKPEDGEDPAEDPAEDQENESEDQQDADESEAEDESDPQEAEQAKPEERLMTEEERKRVMERNREYQEAGEALKRILRMRRKIPAKRDW